eukprot:52385-Amphidinium_carterae.1
MCGWEAMLATGGLNLDKVGQEAIFDVVSIPGESLSAVKCGFASCLVVCKLSECISDGDVQASVGELSMCRLTGAYLLLGQRTSALSSRAPCSTTISSHALSA